MSNDDVLYKRSLLYYPTIQIPSGVWLKQAVLFWDEIGSIIPKDYMKKWLIGSSHDLDYLIGEGEFYAFDTKPAKNEDKFRNDLFGDFKTIIESPVFQKELSLAPIRLFDYKIHLEKMDYQIESYVLRNQLASRISTEGIGDYNWIFFEKTTALLYMSLLAKYLARYDTQKKLILPGTDRPEYQNLLFNHYDTFKKEIGLEITLKNWLPIPDKHVRIEEVVGFKRKYQDELLSFQLLITETEQLIRRSESADELKEVEYQINKKKEIGLKDLKASLKSSKLDITWGNISALIGVSSSPFVGLIVGKFIEPLISINPILTSAIVFGVTAGLTLRAYNISQQNITNAILRNSPYSYLFHAQKEYVTK